MSSIRWIVALILLSNVAVAQTRQQFEKMRDQMVDEEIVAAGIEDKRVIAAMRKIPRHEFVSLNLRRNAYFDMALPIGESQTISPPFVVAYMTASLSPKASDKVLEIGTGSGYQAAVLSPLVKEVYSIEIVESLGRKARRTLQRLGYDNVHVKLGDGYQGWPEHAPFDKIIVTCSPEKVPRALVEQLAEGGQMVIPVGERYQQNLYLLTKKNGKLEQQALQATLFVPMTGAAEERRKVQPDAENPSVYNGGFETLIGKTQEPEGWHYQRYMEVVEDADEAREGKIYVSFENDVPGRLSFALQGFAVDGRKVSRLDLKSWAKAKDLRFGQNRRQWPGVAVTFYDERRSMVGHVQPAVWSGSFDWTEYDYSISVPLRAREAIVRIGLLGGVGDLQLDGVTLERHP